MKLQRALGRDIKGLSYQVDVFSDAILDIWLIIKLMTYFILRYWEYKACNSHYLAFIMITGLCVQYGTLCAVLRPIPHCSIFKEGIKVIYSFDTLL